MDIVLVMEWEWDHIVTGNKKGNILGNRTKRQNGQCAHRSVAIQEQIETERGVHTIEWTVNAWMRSDNRVQGDRMSWS